MNTRSGDALDARFIFEHEYKIEKERYGVQSIHKTEIKLDMSEMPPSKVEDLTE